MKNSLLLKDEICSCWSHVKDLKSRKCKDSNKIWILEWSKSLLNGQIETIYTFLSGWRLRSCWQQIWHSELWTVSQVNPKNTVQTHPRCIGNAMASSFHTTYSSGNARDHNVGVLAWTHTCALDCHPGDICQLSVSPSPIAARHDVHAVETAMWRSPKHKTTFHL